MACVRKRLEKLELFAPYYYFKYQYHAIKRQTILFQVASAYKQLMAELAQLLGANIAESAQELNEIFEMEKSLSNVCSC